MKTYVLTLSRFFPATHKRKGDLTFFRESFREIKLHTIRANAPLWAKRIAEVQQGNAVLSVRQWSGKPYRSKQELIANLTKDDGVGIQLLKFQPDADGCYSWKQFVIDNHYKTNIIFVANNDGLLFEDWKEWFRNYDLSKPLAIIHFTKFRY